MSVRMMAKVWDLDLPQPLKFLALALADWADDDGGNIYPSVATIARKVGASERTIQRQLRELEDRQLIEVCHQRTGGRGRTRQLKLHPEKGDKLTPRPQKGAKSHEKGDTRRVKGDTAMSPDPSENHQIEPPADFSNSEPELPPRLPGESRAKYVARILDGRFTLPSP